MRHANGPRSRARSLRSDAMFRMRKTGHPSPLFALRAATTFKPCPPHREKSFDSAPGAGVIIPLRRFELQLAGALQMQLKRTQKPALVCAQRVFCCLPSLIKPTCGGRKTSTAKPGLSPRGSGHVHPPVFLDHRRPQRRLFTLPPGLPACCLNWEATHGS